MPMNSGLTRDMLTADQAAALSALEAGDNLLIEGQGGVGKSALLELYLEECRRDRRNVLACAPTGIAALNLPGGSTMHRAFGLRFMPVYNPSTYAEPVEELVIADVVVIDEISMCRVDLFDYCMNMAMQVSRSDGSPVQVVCVGDFYQLPPVVTERDMPQLRSFYPRRFHDGFAFEGVDWSVMDFKRAALNEVVRQSDAEHVAMLQAARVGDRSCEAFFNMFVGADIGEDAVRLFPHNSQADAYNKAQAAKLRGEARTFRSRTQGSVRDSEKPTYDDMRLSVGARVMTLVNDAANDYQNGSCGVVEGFSRDGVYLALDNGVRVEVGPYTWDVTEPVVKYDREGKEYLSQQVVGRWTQLPLKLAYAITIHKSQGQTYDRARVDPRCFAPGQLYVALSRVKSLDGLSLTCEIPAGALAASPTVAAFYKGMLDGRTI